MKGITLRPIDLSPNPAGHAAPVTHVAVRSDGRRLASCSYDGTVLVWDISDPARPVAGSRLHHRRLVNACAWNPSVPQLLATASADKTAAVWRVPDAGPARLTGVLARHTDDINSIAWMPDGERLICVSEDGRATLWDALSGALLGEVSSHQAHCMMVSVSAEGLVATVGEDGMVAVSRPGSPGDAVKRHYDTSIEGCAWSHSGTALAIARDDGSVDVLTDRLRHVRTMEVSDVAARAVGWSQDDATLVVGSYDGSLHFFDAAGRRTHQIHDARMWPRSLSVAGGLVAAGSFWSGPHLYDLDKATEVAGPESPTHGPNAMAAHDGRLFIGCDSGKVLVVDVPRTSAADIQPEVRELPLTEGPVLSLAVREGALYAGTYSGHVVRFADGVRTSSEQLGAPLPSLCFDGERLVAGTYNGELIALDARTLAVEERKAAHDGSVKSLTAFGDGFLSAATDRRIAAGSLHSRTTLWEHGNLVNAVAGLGDRVAASASRDHTVKVGRISDDGSWRIEDIQTLLGPDESVKCVGILGRPDAPVVIAGSYDFRLHAWSVDWADSLNTLASGGVLAEFDQGVSCIAAVDTSSVAVAGWDGRVLLVGQGDDGSPRVARRWDVTELRAWAAEAERAS
ncbi:WD40 repeat domain-containing protein [Streptomyces griseoviridis]